MNLQEDRYEDHLWMWNGQAVFPITSGTSDSAPRWSPDRSVLAFLTKGSDPDAKSQIALRAGMDDVAIITSFDLGVGEFAWSPDGSRIVAAVKEYVDGMATDEERTRAPRRIAAPGFRYDDKSWTYNFRTHLWLIDAATGHASRLTDGDSSEEGPAWSPDGSTIAYLSNPDPRRWIRSLNRVFTIDVESRTIDARSAVGQWDWAEFNTDGSLLAVGVPTETETLDLPQVWKLDADPTQFATVDVHITASGRAGAASRPSVTDNGAVLCLVEDRGRESIAEVNPQGSSLVVGGMRAITGFTQGHAGRDLLFTYSTPSEPGAVGRVAEGEEQTLTDLNAGFAEAAGLIEPKEFTYESDGSTIHGWVLLPEGEGKVPLLFNIHGGPAAQYTWGFFDEFQVYVGAGYGVVGVNPRGSSGYGQDHVRVPVGRWGDEIPPDQLDLKTAPYEAAKQFERLDLDRMGIMGGSYGGLSTVMVTSMDDRYLSAVAERGVYNWVSFAGTSDIPWFVKQYLDAEMPQDVDAIWQASSLSRAHKITTPTLVIHSEDDFRCPVEQGQQLFTLLYSKGVDTEFVLFPPGEGHELSRSGKPKHRVERFEAILEWHQRHLG
jgi:dipeptidyl aminopeptidase/acylaminoacyl peptidase